MTQGPLGAAKGSPPTYFRAIEIIADGSTSKSEQSGRLREAAPRDVDQEIQAGVVSSSDPPSRQKSDESSKGWLTGATPTSAIESGATGLGSSMTSGATSGASAARMSSHTDTTTLDPHSYWKEMDCDEMALTDVAKGRVRGSPCRSR